MSVYIDTSAFYAIIDASDAEHSAAVSIWKDLLTQGEILITSSYVITEIVALLHNRFGTEAVRRFVEENMPAVEVRWIQQDTHAIALGAMMAFPGRRGPSLTDCASLEVIRQTQTRSIFAYDQHFANLGIRVLG